jgi:hypothetical protein
VRRIIAVSAVTAASLGLVACGDKKSKSSTETASPAAARKQVGETRIALAAAMKTYKSGDKAAAEEQVSEAYLQHFEGVEGPLGKRDAALKEELEDAIATELRQKIKSGSGAEVAALYKEIVVNLSKAEALLR